MLEGEYSFSYSVICALHNLSPAGHSDRQSHLSLFDANAKEKEVDRHIQFMELHVYVVRQREASFKDN